MADPMLNPAEEAAQRALSQMYECLAEGRCFKFEAGAGAGKTYSLVKALEFVIGEQGNDLLRRRQKVACITYTNVASDEIRSRIGGHQAVSSSTIHSFCWSLIKDFQPALREHLPALPRWQERLEEVGGIGMRRVGYDLGYPTVGEAEALLGHNDVLLLAVILMGYAKFRRLLTSRYPVLFIDEYQDTDRGFAEALKSHFLDSGDGPLIGLFGDHWQKIYGTGCGGIEHRSLQEIGKEANFRSVKAVVDVLNRMRPELPQQVTDPDAEGSVAVYHTNGWRGTRRSGSHWAGDLPPAAAHAHLVALRDRLTAEGWDFSPENTKILMLTHNILAGEQGYSNLADSFTSNDRFVRKEDDHILFFVDTLEPVCAAYGSKRFGEMFTALGARTPTIRSHAEKDAWTKDMDRLMELRATGTVGEVVDHLRQTRRPRLPEEVERKERELEQPGEEPSSDEPSWMGQLRRLRDVQYQEVMALDRFIDDRTPFSTKHGVKGAEFENVLVVVGRGWNQYDFNHFLEWAGRPDTIPPDKREAFERNRNLFYVVCSRPKRRLAVLFTQKLSDTAITTLVAWFGRNAIHPFGIGS